MIPNKKTCKRLGAPWDVLGASCGVLGRLGCVLGASSGRLRGVAGRLLEILGRLLGVLGNLRAPWAVFGTPCGRFWSIWAKNIGKQRKNLVIQLLRYKDVIA